MQLDQPLDFYAVTDHGFYLGVVRAGADTTTDISKFPVMKQIHNMNAPENLTLESIPTRNFRSFIGRFRAAMTQSEPLRTQVDGIMRTTWADEVHAADSHYEPVKFTTFAAYEFSSTKEDGGSMHRNVIFRGTENMPAMPFNRLMSLDPADLWTWMDDLREKGVESLAIPHNSNKSNGQMFELATWAGDPMTLGYNEQRIRNEPLVEISQVKGTSETHPALSMNDEWAGFEIDPYVAGDGMKIAEVDGGYVCDALKKGLALESEGIGNPFKYGFIGSSDTHTGAGSYDESNFFSKVGLLDSTSVLRGSVPIGDEALQALKLTDADNSGFYVASDGRRYLFRELFTGVRRGWPESGLRRTPGNPSRTPSDARKLSRPRGRVCACASLRDSNSMLPCSRTLMDLSAPMPVVCQWAVIWLPDRGRCRLLLSGQRAMRDQHRCSVCRSSRAGSRMANHKSRFLMWRAQTDWLSMRQPIAVRTMVPRSTWQTAPIRQTAPDQPYIHRLTRLGALAEEMGPGIEFADEVSSLIWGGTQGWDQGDHLAKATERAGLDLAEMDRRIVAEAGRLDAVIEKNQVDHDHSGHWGVPTCAFRGEPFFGQDRLDVLLWRLKKEGLQTRQGG